MYKFLMLLSTLLVVFHAVKSLSPEDEKLRISLECPEISSSDLTELQQIRKLYHCSKVTALAKQVVSIMEHVFDYVDINLDGEITVSEVTERFNMSEWTTKDAQRMDICDIDQSGGLDEDEFASYSVISYGEMLMLFDSDNNSLMSRDELEKFFKTFDEVYFQVLTEGDLQDVIDSLNKNADDYYEILDMIKVDMGLFDLYMKKTSSTD